MSSIGSSLSLRPAAGTPVTPLLPLTTRHPLEDSDRLAWQATAAVGLLERFGDLVATALAAVQGGDDTALVAALDERERLLQQLEPLLADLSAARQLVASNDAGPSAERAIGSILRPVDEALRYAKLLHLRLDEPQRGGGLALVR